MCRHRLVRYSAWAVAVAAAGANAASASTMTAEGDSDPPKDPPDEELHNWSSLIGIVTAIVGNVLIALALNVQRYAHIRLHREKRRTRERAKAAERRAKLATNGRYGTIVANGTSGTNGPESETWRRNSRYEYDGEAGVEETEPLVAHVEHQESSATACESDEEEGKALESSYLKSPYWWLGQVLITLGEMGNFLAYGFAPASIVSPLGVVALISNCVIAPILFHEKFRHRDFWGVVIAVAGAVTVVLSANQEETKLAPHDVWDAITTLEFEIYLAVTITLIAILMWFSGRYGSRTILIDLGLVGLFGGYTALATKGVSSMLSSTLFRAFTTPVTYVLVVVLLGTAIMQIRYVNRALQRFESTEVIPIQFVMFTLCVIIGSAVLYRDFERTTATQAVKFVGGCLLTFFGVFLITSGRPPKDDEDMLSDVDGIEETIGLAVHDASGATSAEAAASTTASRRSSKSSRSSRMNFDAFMKPFGIRHDAGVPSLRTPANPGAKPSPSNENRPFLSNPWPHSSEDVDLPQGVRTMSSDTIPSRVSRASTASSTDDVFITEPSTPLNNSSHPQYPTDGPQTLPRSSAKAHSRHFNGPIISPSPFSSTVSAVVKDTLRKHAENPLMHKSSLGRIRSSIRASLFISDDDQDSDEASTSREPLFGAFAEADEYTAESADSPTKDGRRRTRSLSDTLGEFFRIKKKRRKNGDADVENGTGEDESSDER